MPARLPEQKPWPMKWIVLVIVIGLSAYTYLTLHYRKTAPAFRPYEDIKSRANIIRLLAAGYQRIPLHVQRPADPATWEGGAASVSAPGGISPELRATLVDAPLLPTEISRVAAAPITGALLAYPIQFACSLPDNHRQLAGAELYVKGSALIIVPAFETLDRELIARSRESIVQLSVPPGALKPGRYDATIVGERASKSWTVQVR